MRHLFYLVLLICFFQTSNAFAINGQVVSAQEAFSVINFDINAPLMCHLGIATRIPLDEFETFLNAMEYSLCFGDEYLSELQYKINMTFSQQHLSSNLDDNLFRVMTLSNSAQI